MNHQLITNNYICINKKEMVKIIKKGATRLTIKKIIETISNKKIFDAEKHSGVIHLKENPVTIQQRLRDEWE